MPVVNLNVYIELPGWLVEVIGACPPLAVTGARMAFVLDLARRNVVSRSGGPFAAAVFEVGSGRLMAAATNLVVASACSSAHAELLALTLAQQAVGDHDLGAPGQPAMEIVTSCEPCAMCLGAVAWSGVRRLVSAARGDDAEALGFDEGPKPADWAEELRRRGIEVVEDVMRDEAVEIMQAYRSGGGRIYNARAGSG
jgi:tRNA(Arg) A34 adenosine deaminase TadA